MKKYSVVETKVQLERDLVGVKLIITKGTRGTVQALLPSHPMGPSCIVQFKITPGFAIEFCLGQEEVEEPK